MAQNNSRTPPLRIPLLRQETDPTATDMRAIQSWGSTIPATLIGATPMVPPVGAKWPSNIQPVILTDTITGTTDGSGDFTVVFNTATNYQFNFAYGYFPCCWPGDVSAALGQTVPVIASCTLQQLVVRCWTVTGGLLANTANIRVTFQLVGA